jgi:hypothetical protein
MRLIRRQFFVAFAPFVVNRVNFNPAIDDANGADQGAFEGLQRTR